MPAGSVEVARLLQLCSAVLPVGAFSYSGGLESLQALGWLSDARSLEDYLFGVGERSLAHFDLPLLLRMRRALQSEDAGALQQACELLAAGRETRELLEQDRALGRAALRLLADLELEDARRLRSTTLPSWPLGFAIASVGWGISERPALLGYAFGWAENQLQAALKCGILGHTAAQRILLSIGERCSSWVELGANLHDAEIGCSLPGLAIASSLHEVQYSRLFRS
ncbi:MAG: urease accessory protein UreF [Polyangiaceae bacterium]|nr:urease accessory protein UreF [Polyangiaceae bacterium]MCB9608186.1 urease accessory protein UreF [Polyangiaceae bacterium]